MSTVIYVVAVGNFVNGVKLYGPFESSEDAGDWAENMRFSEEWNIILVNSAFKDAP